MKNQSKQKLKKEYYVEIEKINWIKIILIIFLGFLSLGLWFLLIQTTLYFGSDNNSWIVSFAEIIEFLLAFVITGFVLVLIQVMDNTYIKEFVIKERDKDEN